MSSTTSTKKRSGRIEAELRAAGRPDRAEHEKRYLKSELKHFGASVPAIGAVVKAELEEQPELSHEDLIGLVEELWARPVHECRMAAAELLALRCDQLLPSDLELVERMLRESRTWALVDGLAASVAGQLIERRPELATTLDRWAADEDFWLRRSALLALLPGLRRGDGDFERLSRYADAMLDERGFFIRKAIGWVLRETSRKRPDVVFEWLAPRARRASGVTVREAVKYLAPGQRAAILQARESPPDDTSRSTGSDRSSSRCGAARSGGSFRLPRA